MTTNVFDTSYRSMIDALLKKSAEAQAVADSIESAPELTTSQLDPIDRWTYLRQLHRSYKYYDKFCRALKEEILDFDKPDPQYTDAQGNPLTVWQFIGILDGLGDPMADRCRSQTFDTRSALYDKLNPHMSKFRKLRDIGHMPDIPDAITKEGVVIPQGQGWSQEYMKHLRNWANSNIRMLKGVQLKDNPNTGRKQIDFHTVTADHIQELLTMHEKSMGIDEETEQRTGDNEEWSLTRGNEACPSYIAEGIDGNNEPDMIGDNQEQDFSDLENTEWNIMDQQQEEVA